MDRSRSGEYSEIIDPHLDVVGWRHRIVVDIGAYGIEDSNSFNLISERKFRGLLVEPDPCNIARIEDEMAKYADQISLAKVAVSTVPGVVPLYLYENPKDSSLVPPDGTRLNTGSTPVTSMTIQSLLENHKIPFDFDVLSVDTNGLDGAIVLELLSSPFRPGLVIYNEASVNPPAQRTIKDCLSAAGYTHRGQREENTAWSHAG